MKRDDSLESLLAMEHLEATGIFVLGIFNPRFDLVYKKHCHSFVGGLFLVDLPSHAYTNIYWVLDLTNLMLRIISRKI